MTTKELPAPRYDYGGDEFVFVNIDEEMSIEANFKVMAVTQQLEKEHLPGIGDICPANSSYMIRLDPDTIDPRDLVHELQEIDKRVGNATSFEIRTRIVDVPVMYRDPWTHETLMRFRDRHQSPDLTDLEYAAKINGYATVEDFIAASSGAPYQVTMVGFVPGRPWCYQMGPRERQIEVPKYLRPRTDTPERTFGHGGCFAVIYPVRGAGGCWHRGHLPRSATRVRRGRHHCPHRCRDAGEDQWPASWDLGGSAGQSRRRAVIRLSQEWRPLLHCSGWRHRCPGGAGKPLHL